jgi:hypothetical protein
MTSFWLGSSSRLWLTSRALARRHQTKHCVQPCLEPLEDRCTPSVNLTVGPGDAAGLIADINQADAGGGGTITLAAGSTYALTAIDNNWYGPNGLPPITAAITIVGNGATIERSAAPDTPAFRLFYVSGGLELPAGSLTLQNMTLMGGLAQGGNGVAGGGGGLGAGGAIFNQGTLNLFGLTLTGNQAIGGNGADPNLGGAPAAAVAAWAAAPTAAAMAAASAAASPQARSAAAAAWAIPVAAVAVAASFRERMARMPGAPSLATGEAIVVSARLGTAARAGELSRPRPAMAAMAAPSAAVGRSAPPLGPVPSQEAVAAAELVAAVAAAAPILRAMVATVAVAASAVVAAPVAWRPAASPTAATAASGVAAAATARAARVASVAAVASALRTSPSAAVAAAALAWAGPSSRWAPARSPAAAS